MYIRQLAMLTTIFLAFSMAACGEPEDETSNRNNETSNINNGQQQVEEVSGTISSDTQWTADTLYVVVDELSVRAELFIEAGTRIEFEEDTELLIEGDGSLIADGTEDAQVLFTGTQETPGWWNNIHFESSDHSNNRMTHTIVEYGGGSGAAMLILGDRDSPSSPDGAVELQNSTLRYSGTRGLRIRNQSTLRNSENNTITGNEGAPARVHKNAIHQLETTSTFDGNDDDVVEVHYASSDRFSSDRTWQNLGLPYRIDNSSDLSLRAVLTLEPGVEMLFGPSNGIHVNNNNGGLRAEGTDEKPIIFTGTDEVPGWWNGIYIERSDYPANILDHIHVEYVGGHEDYSANLIVGNGASSSVYNADVTLSNSYIANSSRRGILVTSSHSSLTDGGGNEFEGNTDDDLVIW